jgi:hypothetical protein
MYTDMYRFGFGTQRSWIIFSRLIYFNISKMIAKSKVSAIFNSISTLKIFFISLFSWLIYSNKNTEIFLSLFNYTISILFKFKWSLHLLWDYKKNKPL